MRSIVKVAPLCFYMLVALPSGHYVDALLVQH